MVAALSPQIYPNFISSWPLEDVISPAALIQQQQHDNSIYCYAAETDQTTCGSSRLGSPNSPKQQHQHPPAQQQQQQLGMGDGKMVVKKLNHNASERDRRKRINELYSSLRSLLPASDHKKKLSIPGTISRVLKYIPELQKEVKALLEKKQALNAKLFGSRVLDGNDQLHHHHYGYAADDDLSSPNRRKHQQTTQTAASLLVLVSVNRLCDSEILVQVSASNAAINTTTVKASSFAEALLRLDQEGLLLLNVSSFNSFGGRAFYNLHLQVMHGTTQVLDLERLREKLLSVYNLNRHVV